MTSTSTAAGSRATVHGYPRQGPNRELKKAVEGYWKGRVDAGCPEGDGRRLRRATWQQLAGAGIHEVPTGDFSYYDHVLDTSVMVGAIPRVTGRPSTPTRSTATSPWRAEPRTSRPWK